jgi:hypothetical protein
VHEMTASWSCALSCASSACDRPMLNWGCGGVHVSRCLWHQHQHGGVDAGAIGGGRRAPTRLLTLGFLNVQVGQAAQTIQSRPIVTPTPRKLICFTAIDLPLAPDPELKINCLSNKKAYRHQHRHHAHHPQGIRERLATHCRRPPGPLQTVQAAPAVP